MRVLATALICIIGACAVAAGASANAVDRFKQRGIFSVCHDPFIYPYSSQNIRKPGFDVDIVRRIAERGGYKLQQIWVDTGTRGGLGRALRNSISKGQCLAFTGIAIDDEQTEELAEKGLVFSTPYFGTGYVLVAQGEAASAQSLEDLKDTTIGVSMATPMDLYLFNNGYNRGLYLGSRRVARGMVEGEIDAAIIFVTSVAAARREYPDHEFTIIEGFQDPTHLRWNIGFAVRDDADEAREMINAALAEMIESGEMAEIIGAYGIPYRKPFDEIVR